MAWLAALTLFMRTRAPAPLISSPLCRMRHSWTVPKGPNSSLRSCMIRSQRSFLVKCFQETVVKSPASTNPFSSCHDIFEGAPALSKLQASASRKRCRRVPDSDLRCDLLKERRLKRKDVQELREADSGCYMSNSPNIALKTDTAKSDSLTRNTVRILQL